MLFLAAAMALALDSMKLHGTKFFRISTFLPYAVPAVVSTMIWGFVYSAKSSLVGSLNDFLAPTSMCSTPTSSLHPSRSIIRGICRLQHADFLQLPKHHSTQLV